MKHCCHHAQYIPEAKVSTVTFQRINCRKKLQTQLNTEHYYTTYCTEFHTSKYRRTGHCECNASRRASYIYMSSRKLEKTVLLNTASVPLEPIRFYHGNNGHNQATRQETYEKLINFRTIRRNATKLNL